MLRVEIFRPGKKIEFYGLNVTSPCKFFIKDEERINLEVLLKKIGLTENQYEITEVEPEDPKFKDVERQVEERKQDVIKKVVQETKKKVQEKSENE